MYAIVDIETTGGAYDEEGITEIAIHKFDGHEVVDQFISLINPERPIQPFVVNLTGINNKMLRNAPKFYEVAKRIIEITEDCVLVAHNAGFDYRMLRTEFRRLGYDFRKKTLCTVELSQKLLPDEESFKLGKLVRSLGIPMSDRHRANGDALATVELFKILLNKDAKKDIITQAVNTGVVDKLPTKLLKILDGLPTEIGVYYIHNEKGDIIYIGKSKNIKKRVNQHFTGSSTKAKKIQLEVHTVTYEKTGNELIALLKEQHEIKESQPKLNRSRKQKTFKYGLEAYSNGGGYQLLQIEKAKPNRSYVITFKNYQEAKNILYKVANEHQLCLKLNGLHKTNGSCFNFGIEKCLGACVEEESAESYNQRVQQVVERYSYQHRSMVVVDKGRNVNERSAILIQDGQYKGYGFYTLNHQINNPSILQSIITPMEENADVKHLIQAYLRKRRVVKILDLEEVTSSPKS